MANRKSTSLNKQTRGDMLQSFFRDISREPRLVLEKIENDCALEIYDMIYGDMGGQLASVPNSMLRLERTMPLPTVYVKAKKDKRKKGKIEATNTETFQFRNFAGYLDMDITASTKGISELALPESLPQAFAAARWGSSHLEDLQRLGLVNKTLLKKIQAVYIKACKVANMIIDPVVQVVDGVTEILLAVKTTNGLLAAWPECEKYLTLPESTSGVLVRVDIKALDATLASLYPPAEKSSLTK